MPSRHQPASAPQRVTRFTLGVVAVGASAGGPQALEFLVGQLPDDAPPLVIVQHMPAPFIPLFANRLNEMCPMRVVVATGGEELRAGTAYIAPGDRHLIVVQDGHRLRAGIHHGCPVHHQRPAIDVLFHSLVRLKGIPAVGILLTGMGCDGADGMVALRRAGHETIAEDPRSCAVFGMPREAIAKGGATHVLTLQQMPARILSLFEQPAADEA